MRNDIWLSRATVLGAFKAEKGVWPSLSSDDAVERRLAMLRINLRRAAEGKGKHRLDDERIAHLDRTVPGWREGSRDDAWADLLRRCSDFVEAHGRLPHRPCEFGAAESQLANWLVNHRQALAGRGTITVESFDAERQLQMERALPGWNSNRPTRMAWMETLTELTSFARRTGRMPDQHAQDAAERKLGKWLYRQRAAAAPGGRGAAAFTSEKRQQMSAAIPEWLWASHLNATADPR